MNILGECPGCSRESEPEARYCEGCGTALYPGDAADRLPDRAELIGDPSAESSGAMEAPSRPGPGRSLAVAGFVVTVAGLLTWQIFQPPTQAMNDVALPLTAIEGRVPTDWLDRPLDEPVIALEPDLSGETTGDGAVAALTEAASEEDLPTIGLGDLSALDDVHLLVSNYTHSVRLDPVTGSVDPSNPEGLAVGHHRDQLILVDGGGEIRLAPIAGPELGQTVVHDGGQGQIAELRVPGDGTLRVAWWDPPNAVGKSEIPQPIIVDLDSAELDRETGFRPIYGHDDVGYEPGYGAFERDPGGGYRRLSDGMPIATGEENVLLKRCDEPGSCERFWLDRASGRRIDRQAPSEGLESVNYDVFGPDDRFLALRVDRGRLYFDTVTGTYLAGGSKLGAASFELQTEVVSPDGRYLLAPTESGLIVHDLETGTSGLLPVDIPGSPRTVLLVPKDGGGR